MCPHCDPCPSPAGHGSDRIERFVGRLVAPLGGLAELAQRRFPRLVVAVNEIFLGGLVRLSLALGILRETEIRDDDAGISNRARVVAQEGRRIGVPIRALKRGERGTNIFSMEIGGSKRLFEGLPHLTFEHVPAVDIDDKGLFKRRLREAGLPCPRGGVFRDGPTALRYVREELGFPAVVKPKSGSLSRHTVCDIRTEDGLLEAVRIAQIIGDEFVVEEHIDGDVYRVAVVDGEVVAACRRERPNVVGNGRLTVGQLVDLKNLDPLRGPAQQRNYTLHKIIISPRSAAVLADQGVGPDSVPVAGEKIYLHDKVILAAGADIHDVTDDIHPENLAMFKRVSELCPSPLVGLDFIMEDISRPHHAQKCVVLEANSAPYIDMHHYPVTGKARNVAGRILEYCVTSRRGDRLRSG
ncbi:hypothetical protein A3C96_03775 [Candidatus Uhrbacteria bacterium RIFCSPHIGHO2_02_FULL_60_10]|uniref:ATP-grasp domain-containing protein n=1 Tax=Candidatus Uhrbacteria bacterium RIFCSPHIGHO2_02_FULL_60_10 TaxID=1802392 RepID=A0A1F7U801_9BACT|nr:MAG: hypothetical protein A3C96_03775 [Candidatus Uhrbacteria bacterium RIFCSPHIGHO2_02_FULL_60_10]